MNSSSTLALHGGPRAVTATRQPFPRWNQEERARLDAALDQSSLFYWDGPQTRAMLEEFRRHYPLRWAMPCSSGSGALHVAVAALQLPPGSEIITSPLTDMGSLIGILYQQCVPVFADIDPHSYNIDPESVRRCLTASTRALMPVHLAGNPSDMTSLQAIAREHGLAVIEDCAQAWGARHRGQPVGTFGDFGCFSLNEFKHISCGDGGIVATNNEALGPGLCKWGDKHYDRITGNKTPATLSPNYRISEPQAAIAAAQLVKLPDVIVRHIHLGTRLLGRLSDYNLLGLSLPKIETGDTHSFWFCMARFDRKKYRCTRDEFVDALRAEGVEAGTGCLPKPVYAYPLFQNHDFFAGCWPLREAGLTTMDYRKVHCPETEALMADSITFTIKPTLTDEMIDQSAAAFAKVARHFVL